MLFACLRRSRKTSRPARRPGLAMLAFCAAGFCAPLFGVARAQQPAQTKPPLPIAVSARVDAGQGEQTRLVFSVNACVAAETYVLDNPDRAIVDLPEINFQIDPSDGQKKRQDGKPRARVHAAAENTGLIASYRFGRLAAGKSRIVVDLAGPAAVLSTICAPTQSGTFELSLALAPQADAAFKAAARNGAEKQAKAAEEPVEAAVAAAQPSSTRKPIVVLDPGHGGIDSGALGRHHVVEKVVVLEFAKALASKLRAGDRYQVVMTRNDDTFVPLGDRVRVARKLGASLFVSLHADTLVGGGAEGATVYTVSERASDREAARVAEHENKADAVGGVESKEDAGDVNDILFDLTRRETRAYSNVFAHSLAAYWKVAARLNKNPSRSAGFVVLKAPDVPSVLLELGYLSNAADSADLTSPQWRDKATGQVAHAIDDFFASQRPSSAASPPDAALKATQSSGN